jgi:hypothetical protein
MTKAFVIYGASIAVLNPSNAEELLSLDFRRLGGILLLLKSYDGLRTVLGSIEMAPRTTPNSLEEYQFQHGHRR